MASRFRDQFAPWGFAGAAAPRGAPATLIRLPLRTPAQAARSDVCDVRPPIPFMIWDDNVLVPLNCVLVQPTTLLLRMLKHACPASGPPDTTWRLKGTRQPCTVKN